MSHFHLSNSKPTVEQNRWAASGMSEKVRAPQKHCLLKPPNGQQKSAFLWIVFVSKGRMLIFVKT